MENTRKDGWKTTTRTPAIYTFYLLVYVYKDISYVQNFVIDLSSQNNFSHPGKRKQEVLMYANLASLKLIETLSLSIC